MAQINDKEREALLALARSTIKAALKKDKRAERPGPLTKAAEEKRGCFVTLHKHGDLRGCIGTIEPSKPLVKGIEENALNAAFKDPRFPPLSYDELSDVDIEISVLTVPRELSFKNGEDLKRKLKPGVHGVILSHGWHRSTFLPQVWEQLPDVESFLGHLCMKAGLSSDCWNDPKTRIQVYEAEFFSEEHKG